MIFSRGTCNSSPAGVFLPSDGEPGLWQIREFACFGEYCTRGHVLKACHRIDANHEIQTMGI
jgi:hypothetical protein